jgi:hypothetical protein
MADDRRRYLIISCIKVFITNLTLLSLVAFFAIETLAVVVGNCLLFRIDLDADEMELAVIAGSVIPIVLGGAVYRRQPDLLVRFLFPLLPLPRIASGAKSNVKSDESIGLSVNSDQPRRGAGQQTATLRALRTVCIHSILGSVAVFELWVLVVGNCIIFGLAIVSPKMFMPIGAICYVFIWRSVRHRCSAKTKAT